MIDAAGTWHPEPDQIDEANVTALMKTLGLDSYEALYALSIQEPERYWRALNELCGLRWSTPYEQFVDMSRGREFPHWFAGGRLNWTDTIFAWAKDPAHANRFAVIEEREDGTAARVTYAELHDRVRRFAGGLKALGIGRGDRVGFLVEPCAEAVVTMIGLSYAGAIVLPLFSGFGADPIAARLKLCGAKALISTVGFKRRGNFIDRIAVASEAAKRAGTDILILKSSPDGAPLPEEIGRAHV